MANGIEAAAETDIVDEAPSTELITEDFIEKFEKQATLYQARYLPACLKLTQPTDWVRMGDKFYLQATGAEKLTNPLGITWEKPIVHRHIHTDEKGSFYEYEVEGIVKCAMLKRYGWFTGNCDSRDQFFTAQKKDVIEGDIRKSAFSNWLVNAVTRLAGIRNPTPEMLQKAGIDINAVGKVDYRGDKTSEQAGDLISEAQQKRLWAISKGKGVDEAALKAILGRDPWKYSSSKDIKRADYDAIVKAVENYKSERQPGQEG